MGGTGPAAHAQMDLNHCAAASCHQLGSGNEREGSGEEQTLRAATEKHGQHASPHFTTGIPNPHPICLNGLSAIRGSGFTNYFIIRGSIFLCSCIQTCCRGKAYSPASCYSPSLEALIPQGKDVKHSSRPRYLSQALNIRAAFQCTTEMQYSYCNLAKKYFTSAKVIHIARITAVAHTHILI